ncbi:hypothetical protein HN011_002187 [Eciton burchellii]|nr:hypothetical protein HN011_002187 [Eciton burchellii]
MKAAAVIFLTFLTRFAYLPTEGDANILDSIFSQPPCLFKSKLITMLLFNRNNPKGVDINLEQKCDKINMSRPVVFIVHGFISTANSSMFYDLATVLKKEHTVFALDWSNSACTRGLPGFQLVQYFDAVNNTRPTAQLLANYILELIDQCKVPLKNIILIGHSLGSHVCGFAAKKIQEVKGQKVARIIAADPAAPEFTENTCEDRLCKTDAECVIILHSSQLGITYSIGHFDYYLNDQFMQPGCSVLDIACIHSRSIVYLINMLNDQNCVFPGRSKSSKLGYPDFTTTDCTTLNSKVVDLAQYTQGGGSYHLYVEKEPPYCTRMPFKCKL